MYLLQVFKHLWQQSHFLFGRVCWFFKLKFAIFGEACIYMGCFFHNKVFILLKYGRLPFLIVLLIFYYLVNVDLSPLVKLSWLYSSALAMCSQGCSLRNTEYIVGAVIFTGHETKVWYHELHCYIQQLFSSLTTTSIPKSMARNDKWQILKKQDMGMAKTWSCLHVYLLVYESVFFCSF